MQATFPTMALPHSLTSFPTICSGLHSFGDEIGQAGGELSRGLNPTPGGSKPRALVVDDAPDVTEMLAVLLRFSGYDVTTSFSASDAVDAARGERFDVVVSDIGMPGMNGYELAATLRSLPDYRAVPMIAVTGFAMYDDRDRALQSGFNAFLTKPINPTDLIQLIERLRS